MIDFDDPSCESLKFHLPNSDLTFTELRQFELRQMSA